MFKLVFKTSFISFLLMFYFVQDSIVPGTKIQDQFKQVIKTPELSKSSKISPDYGRIPLYFIPNEGQVNEKALFYAKASRYTLWLTKKGLIFESTRRLRKDDDRSHITQPIKRKNPKEYTYERDVSRLMFLNSYKEPEVVPIDQTEHKVNYFIGKDKSKWQTDIQTSSAVLYKELYPYIDLNVYGVEQQIEYDFVVKPGGEVSDISFEYKDTEKTRIDKDGNLVVKTKFGELEHAKPLCYQVIGGERVGVKAEFKKIENNTYGFEVEDYNKNYELIIDPLVLVYSTYLGGSYSDRGKGIAVDSEGAAYVTGETWSTDFPTRNPIQGSYGGGGDDAFITKISSSGKKLIYSTYLGGSEADWGNAIAVDSEGAAYVTGVTESTDFPTRNPIQRSYGGGFDAFITKISSSGKKLIYSTYLGGSYSLGGSYLDNGGSDNGRGIAVDSEGAAYVTGGTGSVDFPTKNPIQGSNAGGLDDVFITKINASGRKLIYSTYLGGSYSDRGKGIAVDSEGAAYVAGITSSTDFPTRNPIQGSYGGGGGDAFITKISSSGKKLIYSTYLGGSGGDSGGGIAVDSEGTAYVIGVTGSVDFPTQDPYQGSFGGGWRDDVFITKINASGRKLIYSTYLGGSEADWGEAIAVDSEGAAYVAGWTDSLDFPTQDPYQGSFGGGWSDAFITKINASGSALVYSTYLGGSEADRGNAIAVDSEGAAYVTGWTRSIDFPTLNPIQGSNAGQYDAFITKLSFSTYSLEVKAGTGGTTDPSPGNYDICVGSEIMVKAIPDEGFKFSHWSGDASGTSDPLTITMDSDKSITANFIRIIYAPLNFAGQKVLNRSLSQAEYINFLTWQANSNNVSILKYRIYQVEGNAQSLLVELNANTFNYWHRGVEKDKQYTYALVAVNNEGREGDRAFITVQ